jgi:uncharacterized membrane protein YdjX (TVP38/TMEM64 family)
MKTYWIVVGLMMLFFLVIFVVFEQIRPSFLADPYDTIGLTGVSAALMGVCLLILDIVIPVPSSLIMIANGALFGIPVGITLSLVGNLGAALVGFFIGRRGEPVLARFVPRKERSRANRLLNEWGSLAIIVTRPVPILAETTIIMAGASTMGWRRMILASAVGSFPVAVLYAIAGATAANFDDAIFAFVLVLLVAGLFWIVGRYFPTPRR